MVVMTTFVGVALGRRLSGGIKSNTNFFESTMLFLWESTLLFLNISHPMLLNKDKSRTTSKMKPWQIYAHAGVMNLSIWFYHETIFEAPHRCNGIPPYDRLSLGFYNLIWLLIPLSCTYHSMVIKVARQSADNISNYDFMASKLKWPSWVLVVVFRFTVAKILSTIPIKDVDYDASIRKRKKRKIEALKVTSFCVTFRRIIIKGLFGNKEHPILIN